MKRQRLMRIRDHTKRLARSRSSMAGLRFVKKLLKEEVERKEKS